jgi:hypothetical protein
MGYNTVVVMLNDFWDKWPERMREAASGLTNGRDTDRTRQYFGVGTVVSCAHADEAQVVVARGNTGFPLYPDRPIEQPDLDAISLVLRGHGYTVRRPGRTRGEGPLPWGFAARQADGAADGRD